MNSKEKDIRTYMKIENLDIDTLQQSSEKTENFQEITKVGEKRRLNKYGESDSLFSSQNKRLKKTAEMTKNNQVSKEDQQKMIMSNLELSDNAVSTNRSQSMIEMDNFLIQCNQSFSKSNKQLLESKLAMLKKPEVKIQKKVREQQMKGEFEKQTLQLMQLMKDALKEDHENIILKQQAISRLRAYVVVDEMLRKKHIQIEFMDQGGCQLLADWIDMNPDKSFPLEQVVELIFDILERLPIQVKHLEESSIVKVLSYYAENMTGMPQLSHKALGILQKCYKYDKEGYHEIKQMQLRNKLNVIRDPNDKNAFEDNLITRTPNGNLILLSSNFDFIQKPDCLASPKRSDKSNSTKQQIKKVFTQMKKKEDSFINIH